MMYVSTDLPQAGKAAGAFAALMDEPIFKRITAIRSPVSRTSGRNGAE